MRKQVICLLLLVFAAGFGFQNCERSGSEMIQLKDEEDHNDLVLFFIPEATYEQKDLFQKTVLHREHPKGRGYDLPEGVIFLYSTQNGKYEGYVLNFAKSASLEVREALKRSIESSPIVHKVYVNIVPKEINDL